jgi:hypothetical protein
VYILFLNADGTVRAEQKISSTQGGLTGPLDSGDRFGSSVCNLGDVDRDGTTDIAGLRPAIELGSSARAGGRCCANVLVVPPLEQWALLMMMTAAVAAVRCTSSS